MPSDHSRKSSQQKLLSQGLNNVEKFTVADEFHVKLTRMGEIYT